MTAENQRRTFISYSRVNKEFASKLAKGLRAESYPVWFDLFDIPTGSRWDDEVERALRECAIFMIILTPASIASENVKDEIGYAIDHGKRILPVLLENCDVPLRLRRFQYVDFTKKSFEEGFENAKELLGGLISETSTPIAVENQTTHKAKYERYAPAEPAIERKEKQEFEAGYKKPISQKVVIGIVGAVVGALLCIAGIGFAVFFNRPTPVSTSTAEARINIQTPASETPKPAQTLTVEAPIQPPPTFTPTISLPLSQSLTLLSMPSNESGNGSTYTIAAQIPYLQGSDDSRVIALNGRFKEIVQKEVDQFKTDVAGLPAAPMGAGSSLNLGYTLIGQRSDVWSVKFDAAVYIDGAAHPNHYSVVLNYDLERGREIALDDLFLPSSNYLQVIADYCKAQLAKRDIGFDASQSGGADSLPENYKLWNLSNEGLVVTFGVYQVASGAAGQQTVVVPFFELKGVSNPQGALSFFQ